MIDAAKLWPKVLRAEALHLADIAARLDAASAGVKCGQKPMDPKAFMMADSLTASSFSQAASAMAAAFDEAGKEHGGPRPVIEALDLWIAARNSELNLT